MTPWSSRIRSGGAPEFREVSIASSTCRLRGEPHLDDHVGQEARRGAPPGGLGDPRPAGLLLGRAVGALLARAGRLAVPRRFPDGVGLIGGVDVDRRLQLDRGVADPILALDGGEVVEHLPDTLVQSVLVTRPERARGVLAGALDGDHRVARLAGLAVDPEDRVQVGAGGLRHLAHREPSHRRRLGLGTILAGGAAHDLARGLAAGPQLEAERALSDEDLQTVDCSRPMRHGGGKQRGGS